MAYRYVAYTPQGEKTEGQVQASTEESAEELLWRQDYIIVSLEETSEREGFHLFAGKVGTRDLIVFSRQFATLIESGIPIVRALYLLQEQTDSRRLKQILSEVVVDVQQGAFLSQAILKHKGAFPMLYGRLIAVGERAGNLEMVLRQLATYLEKEEALVHKIRGAMAYPVFVLVMALGVVLLMVIVALPPLMELFNVFDAELPLPTRVLIAITEFFAVYKFHVLGAMAAVVTFGIIFFKTETGKAFFDRLFLRVPLVGKIIVQGAVARMCRSIATLLRAGIALPEIMEMVIRTQGNTVIKEALSEVHSELLQGEGLAEPMGERDIFPAMLVQMVRVGEETGALDSNMDTLAIFYEEEVDRAVDVLSGAMTPALTIFIGVLVGFVALAVIMPMYSLMGDIG
ncbi:MAG: type II secretion system F family protein [Anaerolineales bacterium]